MCALHVACTPGEAALSQVMHGRRGPVRSPTNALNGFSAPITFTRMRIAIRAAANYDRSVYWLRLVTGRAITAVG